MPNAEQPLVTVITVAYNSSAYLRVAIESVLAQSYANIEYIICDDYSTDDTWDIICEYTDARIRAYRNEKNLTEYVNRNKCIGLSTGEFIFFVDGDDLMLYRGIEDSVREMIRYPDCGFGLANTSSTKFLGPLRIDRKDAIKLEFFGGGFLDSSLSNNVFRTSFIKHNLFLTRYKNADTYSRINFLKSTNVLVMYAYIGVWRDSPGQTSKHINKQRQLWEKLDFYQSLIYDIDLFDDRDKESFKTIYYRIYFNYLLVNVRRLKFNIEKRLLLDSLPKAVSYLLAPRDTSFWSNYDWNNINMRIDQHVQS